MYVVVVGAGKVGYYLTKSLLSEGEEVVVIEKDPIKADRIIKLGATAIQGDGAEVSTLELAGAGRANVVAAVTGEDEDNLVVAQVAKARFDVPRTVVRINNPRNEAVFHKLGIDSTVSATEVILSTIQQEIPKHAMVHLLTLQDGTLEFVEFQLTAECSASGKQLRDLNLPPDTRIPAIVRDGKPVMTAPDSLLEPGDRLIVITTAREERALRQTIMGTESVPAA
ncbi:MAG: potassium channel family protein [Chloroflexota bacterium]